MDDELLARLAPLVGMVLAGEDEGVLDAGAVDLDGRVARVLLDDREEVAQQATLGLRELLAADRRMCTRVLQDVDGRARVDLARVADVAVAVARRPGVLPLGHVTKGTLRPRACPLVQARPRRPPDGARPPGTWATARGPCAVPRRGARAPRRRPRRRARHRAGPAARGPPRAGRRPRPARAPDRLAARGTAPRRRRAARMRSAPPALPR